MNKFGILEDLLNDQSVTEIMVNGLNSIYLERQGKLSLYENNFNNEPELLDVIKNILGSCSKTINPEKPFADARLPGRLQGQHSPAAALGIGAYGYY